MPQNPKLSKNDNTAKNAPISAASNPNMAPRKMNAGINNTMQPIAPSAHYLRFQYIAEYVMLTPNPWGSNREARSSDRR